MDFRSGNASMHRRWEQQHHAQVKWSLLEEHVTACGPVLMLRHSRSGRPAAPPVGQQRHQRRRTPSRCWRSCDGGCGSWPRALPLLCRRCRRRCRSREGSLRPLRQPAPGNSPLRHQQSQQPLRSRRPGWCRGRACRPRWRSCGSTSGGRRSCRWARLPPSPCCVAQELLLGFCGVSRPCLTPCALWASSAGSVEPSAGRSGGVQTAGSAASHSKRTISAADGVGRWRR